MREQVHLLQPSVAEIIANELVGCVCRNPRGHEHRYPRGRIHRYPRGACTGQCTQKPQGDVYRAVYTDTPGGRVQGSVHRYPGGHVVQGSVHRYPRGACTGLCTQIPQGTCTSIGTSDCTKVKGEGLLPHTLESAARFPFCSFLWAVHRTACARELLGCWNQGHTLTTATPIKRDWQLSLVKEYVVLRTHTQGVANVVHLMSYVVAIDTGSARGWAK